MDDDKKTRKQDARKDEVTLVLVWIALVLLLAASAGLALLRLGAWNGPISLGIAAVKAALVLWFFMRLRSSHGLIWTAAMVGLVALTVLFGLSGMDFATRPLHPAPMQAPAQLAPLVR